MASVLLVTGTSSGVGLSVAVQAAKAGFTTYASMRNLERRAALDEAAEAAGVSLNLIALDVQDTASVDAAVSHIVSQQGRIDTLVANAGVGFARTTEQATEDDMQWVFDTNVMGVIRCTKAVLPHMRKQRSGRVIAISSVGGLVGQPFNEIYCASKFAVEGYIESLASYVGPAFGIHFTAVEPGGITSEFTNSALKHFAETGGMIEDEYLPLIRKYLGGREGRTKSIFQTSDEVAQTIMNCMSDPNPPIRCRTSPWSQDFTRLKTSADPDGKKLQAEVVLAMLGTSVDKLAN